MQTKAHLFGPNEKYGILQKSKCMPYLKWKGHLNF